MLSIDKFPIYRAESLYDGIVEGNLFIPLNHHETGIDEVIIIPVKEYYDDPQPEFCVNPNTLQISMPNDIDKNGNRVFKDLK